MPLENEPNAVPEPVADPQPTPPVDPGLQSAPEAQPTPDPVVPEPTPEPPAFSLRDYAEQNGIDVGEFATDADLASHVLTQLQEARAAASFYQNNKPEPAAPTPEPEPAPKEPEWDEQSYFKQNWDMPEADPSWVEIINAGYVVQDESGRWIPAPGNDWIKGNPALASMNAYESKIREVRASLFDGNPFENINRVLQEVNDRRYVTKEELQQMMQQQTQQQSVYQLEDQLAPHLYVDQNAAPRYGTPEFTANLSNYGKQFFGTFDKLVARGMQPEEAMTFASELLPVPQQAAPPQPTPGNPPAEPPQSKPTSFVEDALRVAQNGGTASTPPASPQDDTSYTPDQVWNMFTDRARREAAV